MFVSRNFRFLTSAEDIIINNHSTGDPEIFLAVMIIFFSAVELLKSIEMKDDEEVVGVTWLENKIYVVFKDTKRVCMFQGRIPYSRMKDTIEVPRMKAPYDMISSQVSRSIFISDTDEESRCVWRIQMSNKSANQWRVDGIPKGLFLASPDKLIVLVELDRTLRSFYAIHIYPSCGVDWKSSIELHRRSTRRGMR